MSETEVDELLKNIKYLVKYIDEDLDENHTTE
jgi:hypothetical protein